MDDAAHTNTRRWLFRVAPLVAGILEFTDGDETRHLITELGELLAEMQPELVPSYYDYLCDKRQYAYAANVLRTVLAEVELSNPLTRALTETVTDEKSLLVLKKRSEAGDQNARACFEDARAFFGEPQGDSTGAGSGGLSALEEEKVSVADYPPERLGELLGRSRLR